MTNTPELEPIYCILVKWTRFLRCDVTMNKHYTLYCCSLFISYIYFGLILTQFTKGPLGQYIEPLLAIWNIKQYRSIIIFTRLN